MGEIRPTRSSPTHLIRPRPPVTFQPHHELPLPLPLPAPQAVQAGQACRVFNAAGHHHIGQPQPTAPPPGKQKNQPPTLSRWCPQAPGGGGGMPIHRWHPSRSALPPHCSALGLPCRIPVSHRPGSLEERFMRRRCERQRRDDAHRSLDRPGHRRRGVE